MIEPFSRGEASRSLLVWSVPDALCISFLAPLPCFQPPSIKKILYTLLLHIRVPCLPFVAGIVDFVEIHHHNAPVQDKKKARLHLGREGGGTFASSLSQLRIVGNF